MAPITRGRLLAVSALAFILTAGTASADITRLRLGVLNDMASGFSAWSGPGSVVAAKLAVEDFRKAHPEADFDIEVLSADHQNKADVASAIARDWIRDGVNAIVDVPNSAAALAVAALVKDSDAALLVSGGGHDALTRDACTPNTVHWTFDLYSLARNTAQATVETGGKSWFFVTSDYAGGKGLEAVATKFVLEAGGEVKGHALPPLGLVDYSSFLLQAQSSGADVVAFGTAGTDLMNMIKQSNEFGLVEEGQRLATLAIFINDVHGLGLEAAKGLIYTTAFYWDTNDQKRCELPSDRARAISAMARAIRPLPSSNGWIVTNQRWAMAARMTGSVPSRLSNQSRNAAISPGRRSASGASKWTRSRP